MKMEINMSKFFDDLKEGLKDVVAYKKGKLTLRSELIEIPEPPIDYKAKEREKKSKRSAKKVIIHKVSSQKY